MDFGSSCQVQADNWELAVIDHRLLLLLRRAEQQGKMEEFRMVDA